MIAAAIPGGLQALLRPRSHLHHEMNIRALFPHGVLIDTNEAFASTFRSQCFQYVLLLSVDFYMLITWHNVMLMARSYQGSDVQYKGQVTAERNSSGDFSGLSDQTNCKTQRLLWQLLSGTLRGCNYLASMAWRFAFKLDVASKTLG